MSKRSSLLWVGMVMVSAATPLWGQTGIGGNRRIEGVAITPSPAVPGGPEGLYDIQIAWVATADIGVVNLNSDLIVMVNSTVVDVIASDTSVDGGPTCGCSAGDDCGGCGGVSSCFVGVPSCGCACGVIISANSGSHELDPDDRVTVLVVPARGGAPETDTSDDRRITSFTGDPVVWHRRVETVELRPVPGAPNTYDVHVEWRSATHGIDYEVDLSAMVVVTVNNVPHPPVPANRFQAPISCANSTPPPLGDCTPSVSCGAGTNGSITFPLECAIDCLDCALGGCSYPCWCQCEAREWTLVSNVTAMPGDQLIVQLVPMSNSLPEPMGLDGDDFTVMTVGAAPTLREARSIANHQVGPTRATAEFAVRLDTTNNPAARTSEPRDSGLRILDFIFDQAITNGLIRINGGPAHTMTLLDGGTRGRVILPSPLPNDAVYTITVEASSGPGLDLVQDICVSALTGDVNDDDRVTAADKAELLGFFGQFLTPANAKYDIQVNGGTGGWIDVGDIAAWTGFFGTTVAGDPCP